MGNSSNNLTRMAIKSMPIADTEATENGENKNPIQQMQIQSYDAVKNCGKLGHYGFYGNAPKGSLVVVIQANGQEECLFGAEDDVNNRPRGLAEGEVMVYNTVTKNYLYLDKDGNTRIYAKENMSVNVEKGNVNITIANGDCHLTAGTTHIKGNVSIEGETSIQGNLTVSGTMSAEVVEAGNGTDGTFTNSVTVEKGITTAGS
jgi:phage gp45-like